MPGLGLGRCLRWHGACRQRPGAGLASPLARPEGQSASGGSRQVGGCSLREGESSMQEYPQLHGFRNSASGRAASWRGLPDEVQYFCGPRDHQVQYFGELLRYVVTLRNVFCNHIKLISLLGSPLECLVLPAVALLARAAEVLHCWISRRNAFTLRMCLAVPVCSGRRCQTCWIRGC